MSVLQSQLPLTHADFEPNLLPDNVLDKDEQQVDLSTSTSWCLEMDQVEMFEFAETQVINAWAPYMLCAGLKRLMTLDNEHDAGRFIVNVSSMEGKFNRIFKSTTHSHTNMAKAALNMLTLTCGPYFANERIYMTCVDTGWVSEMNPGEWLDTKRTVPLDELDGAMRVLDPIIRGVNKRKFMHSVFLKDYKQTSW